MAEPGTGPKLLAGEVERATDEVAAAPPGRGDVSDTARLHLPAGTAGDRPFTVAITPAYAVLSRALTTS